MQFILINCNNDLKNIVAFLILATLAKLILYLIIVTFDNIVAYQKHQLLEIIGIILGLIMSLIVIQIGLYFISLYPEPLIQNQIAQSLICKRIILNLPYVSQDYILFHYIPSH